MFDNNAKVVQWILILSCISLIFAGFFDDEEDKKNLQECMKELGVSQAKVKEMEDADEPNSEYSCFFGCMSFKEGLIMKNGQMNKTWVDAAIATMEDKDEKEFMQEFYKVIGNDLKNATDTCSAGAYLQNMMYNLKKAEKELTSKND
ncbi:uncharacterized protein LOC129565882 [Sitodiplosis mosellana]|uniref:uncharacterized protein LOC129565882 n=1 Tax=Sitodiplosis mosellana TaxID=263140 RepID=UPI002443DB6C|nr:uncharacterized protein LOC129565882 [Sitodiplosis mosellana]